MIKKGFYKGALIALIMICPVLVNAKSAGLAGGNLTTADACGFGVGYLGGYVGILDDATNFFGSLSYGFSEYTEGRIKLGFSDPDYSGSDPELFFGADFKYEFMDYYDKNANNPADMAFGGFIEYIDYSGGDNYSGGSVLQIGGNYIASIPYRFSSGKRIIPYGRADLRLEKISSDGGGSDSDFQFGLNLGVKYELSTEMNLYAEFQIDGLTGLFAGIDVRVF